MTCPTRNYLLSQGVKSPEGLRRHVGIIEGTLRANPSFPLEKYRLNPDNPEGTPLMG